MKSLTNMDTVNLTSTPPTNQKGAVLAISLVLLLVMTLLGIAALNTTKLEQHMAGNFQATNRAFETAETGLANAMYGIPDAETYTGDITKTSTDYVGSAALTRDFLRYAKLQREDSKISSAVTMRRALFEASSTGKEKNSSGDVLATVTLHGGFYLILPDPTAK